MTEKFNPSKYLTKIKGKDYLEVKYRLIWFREVCPDWGIETEVVASAQGAAQVKATIKNAEGRIIAQAHKMETKQGFFDYLEKAETGAVGRALAMCGFGTQFTAGELDEGDRIVDAPVEKFETTIDHVEKRQADIAKVIDGMDEDKKNSPATPKQTDAIVKVALKRYGAEPEAVQSFVRSLTIAQASEFLSEPKKLAEHFG